MSIIEISVEKEGGNDYLRDDDQQPVLRTVIDSEVREVTEAGTGSKITVDEGKHPLRVYEVSENASSLAALLDPTGTFTQNIETGITASVTQTQVGGYDLTKSVNVISTSANAGDTVVLPVIANALGQTVKIVNNGANTVSVFPASGEFVNEEVVDAKDAVDIAAGTTRTYWIKSATKWVTLTK